MIFKKGLIILIAFVCILPTATAVQAQQTTLVVTGSVMNGTPNGSLPENGEVTIQFYTDTALGNSYTTNLNSDGSFTFEDLGNEVGNYFMVYTEYEGVVYSSVETQLLGSDNPKVLVMIYETSDKPEDIQITNIYYLIYPGENGYQISEIIRMENRSQTTYTGSMSDGVLSTFTWTPPEGAQEISFLESSAGSRYVNVGQNYYDTYPVRPVPYYQEVDVAYQLPFAKTVTYSNHFEYPVQQIIISGNLENIEIRGNGLTNEEIPENQVGLSTAFSAGPFDANEEITFDIIGNQSTLLSSFNTGQSGFTFNLGSFLLGISSLLLAALFSIVFFRQPSYPACPESVKPEVRELALLKHEFNRSEISPAEYQTQRKQLTSKIKKKLGNLFPKSN